MSMTPLPFTMRQLEVFSSICETGSFSRTAEELGISQASVSSRLKSLEEQIGLTLLARHSGRRPTLTKEGMAFLSDLRAFVAAGEVLAAHRRKKMANRSPQLFRIRIGRAIMDKFIRPKLDRFIVENDWVDLEFEIVSPYFPASADLDSGKFDFAFFHLPSDNHADPRLRMLAEVRAGVFGHRSFAEGQNVPLSAKRISDLPFILPKAGSDDERYVRKALQLHGITPRHIVSRTPFFDVMVALLERGVAVCSTSDLVIPAELRSEIVLLNVGAKWRLAWFRKDLARCPMRDAVEKFLIDSVVGDANYPAVEVFASGVSRAG